MRLTPLLASTFRSDGGTMFGLVPRALWEKKIQPDARHTIPQHAHVFLVELADGRRGLVDTGCGSAERFDDRAIALNGLGPGWPLLENVKALGVAPEDIAFVVFTHLHWDHAGGAVAPASWGRTLTFPQARHYVHALEWQDATSGDPLLYKSYPPAIVEALRTADLHLVPEDDAEILPGLRLLRTSGHTRGHCAVWFQPALPLAHPAVPPNTTHNGFLLAGDVCPSQHNLRMVFQTSYDTFPLDTRAWKRRWLPRLAAEHIGLLFDHDPELLGAFIRPDPRDEFVVETPLPFPPA